MYNYFQMRQARRKIRLWMFYPLTILAVVVGVGLFALLYRGGGLLMLEDITAKGKTASLSQNIVPYAQASEAAPDAADFIGPMPAPAAAVVPVVDTRVDRSGRLEPYREGSLWGYKNAKGEIAIPPRFSDALPFYDNYTSFAAINEDGQIRYGLLSRTGSFVVEPLWDQVQPFSESRAAVCLGEKWAYIDEEGNFITDYIYRDCGSFHNGRAKVRERSYFGYIDLDGDLACSAQWTQAGDFGNDMAFVTLSKDGKSKSYVIDKVGTPIVTLDGGMEGSRYSEKFAAVRRGSEYSFWNIYRTNAFKLTFENARNFSTGLAAVQLQGQWGYINTRGVVVIEPQFDAALDFQNNRAPVRDASGKWGYIDRTGDLIIPCLYDEAQVFNCDYALVRQGSNWGLVNSSGTFTFLYAE